METAEELAKYSVARKLLRELSSVTISGRDILRYLQAGSLMGCLTHLSLAGMPVTPLSVPLLDAIMQRHA